MTAPDRIGQHLPELLTELAAPRVPDYVDDMLRRTAATSQLPAWASLERWLPMGALARTAPRGLPSWRPVLILVALVLALAAATALIAGSQPRVPAPFGPARNGELLAATAEGELVAINPATGERSAVDTDAAGGFFPHFSPDGTRYLRSRIANGVETMNVVAADGSGERRLFEAPADVITWADWSPTGDTLVVVTETAGKSVAQLVDVATAVVTPLDVGVDVFAPLWRQNGTEVVFKGRAGEPGSYTWAFYVAAVDGSGVRPFVPVVGDELYWAGSLSPDGGYWVYSKWTDGVEGRIYQVDIDAGTERPLPVAGDEPGTADLQPVLSPDDTLLLVQRFVGRRYTSTLVRKDGSGEAIPLGGDHDGSAGNPGAIFSPDGTRIVVRHPDDGSTWIHDTATGTGIRVDGGGGAFGSVTWQRLAP